MATSRSNQTRRKATTRRTAAKVTETPESSALAAEPSSTSDLPPETVEAPSTPDPIAETVGATSTPDLPQAEASEQSEAEQSAPQQTDPISESSPESELQTPPTEPTPEVSPMSNAEVIEATATPAEGKDGSAIEIRSDVPSLSIWNRPVMPSDIEIADTIQSSGIRPIEASHMDVFGTILNGRPILSSNLKVAEMLPGNRPIFFSDFHSVSALTLAGDRPVMASAPGLMHAEKLPGDRPIFTNDIDDPGTLMGFID